jgi:Ser/Thr protein kinase RdoA (MazF antagonist)
MSAWDITATTVVPHDRGMNSRTWFVETDGARLVAKAVPADRRESFEAALAVATLVESAGIPAGAPVPTRGGRASTDVAGNALAVLRWVRGSELTGRSETERRMIGSTLGRVHLALAGRAVAGAGRFHWLDPTAPHLTVRPWVRPSIEGAIDAWNAIDPSSLTWGLLHTDPAPEAFLHDASTGEVGSIDWDLGMSGPLLYDLASAEMYVGGPERSGPLIEAYLETGPLRAEEVERALRTLARMRWAVQADYFAKRVTDDDMTGIDGPAGNEEGLDDARQALSHYDPRPSRRR